MDEKKLKRFKPLLPAPRLGAIGFCLVLLFCPIRGLVPGAGAQCSIQGATFCGGFDDYGIVWINGNQIAVSMSGYTPTQTEPCVTVPAADLVLGTNVLAVQSYNLAPHYNWASWSLAVNMGGSTVNVTSSSGGVQMWNQPAANGPPPPSEGAVTWWSPSYVPSGWTPPVNVTYPPAFYYTPVNNPIGGGLLPPIGADLDGGDGNSTSTTLADQVANASLYFQQTFTLTSTCPTATPAPDLNITKSILGPTSGVTAGQPVTYVIKTCNTGGRFRGP